MSLQITIEIGTMNLKQGVTMTTVSGNTSDEDFNRKAQN